MINRKDVTHDCPNTSVSLKFSTLESESAVLDMLTDFTRLNDSVTVESFTVTTKTIARYDAKHAARLAAILRQESERKW